MIEDELRFIDDDKLICYTPIPNTDGLCKIQLVMTKEIFQECYKRWIEQP